MDDKDLAQLMDITNDAEQMVQALKPGAMQNLLLELIKRHDHFIDSVTEAQMPPTRPAPQLTPERQARVEQAIAQLTMEGREITNAAVLRLAGGNNTAVGAYLRDWRQGQAPPEPQRNGNGNGGHGASLHSEEPGPYVSPVPPREPTKLERIARRRQDIAAMKQEREQIQADLSRGKIPEDRYILDKLRAKIESAERDIAQLASEISRGDV